MSRSKRVVAACFLLSALLAIAEDEAKKAPEIFAKENSVTDSKGNEYFPKKYDNWYRPHLRAMEEPSIFSQASSETFSQFRFLYLSTFAKPISFRGFKSDDRFYVRVIRLTGKGGYDPGEIEIGVNVEITQQEWSALKAAIIRSFKETKLTDLQRDLISGLDGSQWVLEASIDGKYYYEEAPQAGYWTSSDGLKRLKELEDRGMAVPILFAFADACNSFLSLTDFTLPSRMVPDFPSE